MKGNPLLRLIFVLLALGGVAWPVFRLTLPSSVSTSSVPSHPPLDSTTVSHATSAGNEKNLQATLRLRVAPTPLHCSIKQGDRTLLTEANLLTQGEYRAVALISPDEDLLVTGEWLDGDPHAIHAEVEFDQHQPMEKDFWAGRLLEDTFPLPAFLSLRP